jgi:Regulator of ribonuclease activity B
MGWLQTVFGRRSSSRDNHDARIADLAVIKGLEDAGADLSRPREVAHYLWLPNGKSAARAAQTLRAEGYFVEEQITDEPTLNPWLVIAKREGIVGIDSVSETTHRFEQLARTLRGEYDGWEAANRP